MNTANSILGLIVLLLGSSVSAAQQAGEFPVAQLLFQYKRELQGALQSGMSGGPVAAVTACQLKAPKIADSISRGDFRVGRASHRLRNPANIAPDWVAPVMAAYVANPSERDPRTVSLPDDRAGYVEPIFMQRLCTSCHGENIAPNLSEKIAELYPEDRAVGFKLGDLRGVFWIEYPLEK